jgi:general stress protein YciG
MDMATRGSGTSNRGFASMDPEKQRAIAAQGGRAAHAQGVAHEFDSEEARAAGRKGGQARSSRSAAQRATSLANADRDIQGGSSMPGSGMGTPSMGTSGSGSHVMIGMDDVLPRGGHV